MDKKEENKAFVKEMLVNFSMAIPLANEIAKTFGKQKINVIQAIIAIFIVDVSEQLNLKDLDLGGKSDPIEQEIGVVTILARIFQKVKKGLEEKNTEESKKGEENV